jgi:ribosomal protein S18 acetylase RimI-like enzyme
MTQIVRIESLERALECAQSLDLAARASLAEIRHEGLRDGAAQRFLERAFDDPETVLLVAREDDVEVGLCLTGAWTEPFSGERFAGVLALHVDAGVRHRGVARALVAAAREALQARGVERLGARVEHNDDARISMGERWGWIRGWEWLDSGTSD